MVAEAKVITNRQLLIGEEAANEPVELAIKGFALQAQFLREGVELTIGIIAGCAIQDVDFTIVGIRCLA